MTYTPTHPYYDPNESFQSVLAILGYNPDVGIVVVGLLVSYGVLIFLSLRLLVTTNLLPSLKYQIWLVSLFSLLGQLMGGYWLVSHGGYTHAIRLHLIDEKLFIVLIVYMFYNIVLSNLLIYVTNKLKPKGKE